MLVYGMSFSFFFFYYFYFFLFVKWRGIFCFIEIVVVVAVIICMWIICVDFVCGFCVFCMCSDINYLNLFHIEKKEAIIGLLEQSSISFCITAKLIQNVTHSLDCSERLFYLMRIVPETWTTCRTNFLLGFISVSFIECV